jgi:hypothetical protein
MKVRFIKPFCLIVSIAFATSSCKKENSASPSTTAKSVPTTSTVPPSGKVTPASIPPSYTNVLSINWDNYKIGATYTAAQATTDFLNLSGWDQSHAQIAAGKSGGACRATLMPNSLTDNGLYASVNLPQASAYQMDYDVKFDPNFNWGFGGKIGFGFLIGNGNTGGDPAWDGNGGSLRMMWFSPNINSDRVYFQPYLYYKDMNGGPASGDVYGDSMGKSFPTSGSLLKGQWYHVHMYVKSNTGTNVNGHAQIIINGIVVLDQDIRWTTNDANRLINTLTLNTFRGGGDSSWETNTTDYVYYDNLSVQKIN